MMTGCPSCSAVGPANIRISNAFAETDCVGPVAIGEDQFHKVPNSGSVDLSFAAI